MLIISFLTIVTEIKIHDEDLVMKSATELGHIHGRDNNWMLWNIEEAIEELEDLKVGSPIENGYEVLSMKFNTKE